MMWLLSSYFHRSPGQYIRFISRPSIRVCVRVCMYVLLKQSFTIQHFSDNTKGTLVFSNKLISQSTNGLQLSLKNTVVA